MQVSPLFAVTLAQNVWSGGEQLCFVCLSLALPFSRLCSALHLGQ